MKTIFESAKIDDQTLGVVRQTTFDETRYTVEYLTTQRATIQAQKDRDNLVRDAELAEVDSLLAMCNELSITTSSKKK